MLIHTPKTSTDISSGELPDPSPLPSVCGFYLLVRPVHIKDEKTKGGIILPDSTQDDIKYLCNVGRVLSIGPYAYRGEAFKNGPWCEGGINVGDYVAFGRFVGQPMKYKGVMIRQIKDVDVKLKIEDPRDIDTFANLGAS